MRNVVALLGISYCDVLKKKTLSDDFIKIDHMCLQLLKNMD